MRWKDWALIAPSLLILFLCGTLILIWGILSLANGDFGGIVEILLGSVLGFLAVYFFMMLLRLKL